MFIIFKSSLLSPISHFVPHFAEKVEEVHLIFSFLADERGWWPFCVAVVVVVGGGGLLLLLLLPAAAGRQLPPLPSQLLPLATYPPAY